MKGKKNIQVVTRDGTHEPLDISIVRKRIEGLCFGLNFDFVNLDLVVHKVEMGVHDGITTIELDNLSAETCAYMVLLNLSRTLFIHTTVFLPPELRLTIFESRLKRQ